MGTRTFRATTTGERFEREWPTEQAAGSLHPWPAGAEEKPVALHVVTNGQDQ